MELLPLRHRFSTNYTPSTVCKIKIKLKNIHSSFVLFYSFTGRRGEMFFPLVYVLTCDRSTATYNTIFSKLKEAEPLLNPRHIMVDFEMAAINAAESIFTQSTIKGCYFHFCQSIYRHVQEYGMQTSYSSNINVAQHIRYIAALAFVPSADVYKCYVALKGFAFFKQKINSKSDNGFKNLLKYVEDTWIGGKNPDGSYRSGRFSIELWNMYALALNGSAHQ